MSDYRHGWIVSGNIAEAGIRRSEGITHYDLVNGRQCHLECRRDDRFGEPVFVPRRADRPRAMAGCSNVIYRSDEGRSDLAVFEATDIARFRWRSPI